tara:strand:+ start:5191 stop:7953 length:2763 start_codon:yes stop_codon:yes gene_type:complete
MLLKNLIKNIPKDKKDKVVTGLSVNSKEIKKNYIFFAIKGSIYNGEKFIEEAISKGASVIICSKNCKYRNKNVHLIRTKDVRYFLSEVASKFYKLKPKNIIAVTGTNGKTSVSDIFYQILRINNIPVATIGTLGIKFNDKIIKSNLTSPDTITLHKQLYYLKKKKINNVIIETSSHGLDQKRLHHVNFKGGIFTNFSQDHLDYHKTMKSYLNAKLILFRDILIKKSIIISDSRIKPFHKLRKIAKKNKFKLYDINEELIKIKKILIKNKNDFQLKNLAMAVKAAKLCALKEKRIYKALKNIKDVDGRLELTRELSNKIKVFIDYAHTPDALFKTLLYLKKNHRSAINLVFGCGGDRDKKKRKFMAKIANDNCKKVYVTDDNPRNEDPKKIRDHLLKHIAKNKALNIGSRELAIKTAIQNANPNEIVLIAGKGHEEYQIYKNKKIKISDKKIVKNFKYKSLLKNEKRKDYSENRLIFKRIFGKATSVNFNGLTIDTRTLKKNNLFLCIKGKNHDGKEFINEAIKKQAGCIVSSSIHKKKNKKIIKTKNVISFLNRFAELKRDSTSAKIIAITGSAGKTSLKNMLNDLLKVFGKTYSSPKSFNNHLGVPVSLSNLSSSDEFGIFEIGMSRAGEIKKLSKLVRPHIGVITNIGEAHLENFKGVSQIAKAKSEIIENIETGGTIVLNRDDKFFNYLFKKAKTFKLKILTFGTKKKSDIRLKKIIKDGNLSKIVITISNQKLSLRVKDSNIFNILSSILILKELGLNILAIKNNFKHIEPSEGRGKKYSISRYKKKFKLIDESYNASPLSVKNAIQKLSMIKKENFKKFLILGDMLELGSKSEKYHKDLSKVINNSDIDKVFIKGKKTIFTYKHLNKDKRGNILQSNEDIDLSLNEIISNNDYLMIKGSNATGLNDYSKKMIKGI